jgi:N-acetylglutamate synthase-like GNAT family acetyltransferase
MAITWHIRKATPEDSMGLTNCMKSAYAPYQNRMDGERLPPMDVDYSSEIKSYPAWVVDSEGDILAGLIMVFENNHASIANIAVDPKSQGKGIGGELMKFAESKAKEHDCSELHLATHVLLNENISLYQHSGWQETGRDNTRVFMKKGI